MGNYFIKSSKSSVVKDAIRWLLTPFQASMSTLIVFFRGRKYSKKSYKYEVALCGLFKNEGRFLKEWIDYHLVVGVEHFYMYNNNSDDNYLEILGEYIESGIVDLIDWPQEFPQMPAYLDCYKKRRMETRWLGYIDIDEFVCPKYELTIQEWLGNFIEFPSVLIYWKSFGTSGRLVHDDMEYVIVQYTSSFEKLMDIGKLFINTSFRFDKFCSPHLIYASVKFCGLSLKIPPVNEFKKFVCFSLHRVPLWNRMSRIQVNHYWSKAHEVFVYNKTKRSDVFSKQNEEIDKYALLDPNEKKCVTRDYTIQRYLLDLHLAVQKRGSRL